jgi:hypothetical protein
MAGLDMIDRSLDMMIFKIHPRVLTATATSAQPTKLLVHVVANQEIVYDESAAMARYMTPNGQTWRGKTSYVGNGYTPGTNSY